MLLLLLIIYFIHGQVEETGQKNTVLTLYELIEGDASALQGWFIHAVFNRSKIFACNSYIV